MAMLERRLRGWPRRRRWLPPGAAAAAAAGNRRRRVLMHGEGDMVIARQSTARTVTIGPVLDADGVAVTGCVVGDFKGSTNGGAPAALNGSATLTHRATGHYSLALTATDLATVGSFEVIIDDTVNACPVKELTVIEEAVYDALYAASAPGYLQPTTAGRTLDVSAGGEAGVDWANVGSPTTTVNLSGTTVATTQKVDVETIKTQAVSCPAGTTIGEYTGTNTAAIAVNGSGQVVFSNTSIATATAVTTVNGLAANVITAASLAADASAEIADAVWDEDATGHQTQGTFGQAIGDPAADANTIYAAVVTGAAGATVAADIVALKAETAEILLDTAEIGAAGAGLTNINLPNQTMDIVGSITGNLSGSVGSVTGAVGSVTGAVGSVTGNVGGNVTGTVGGFTTAAKAEIQTEAEDALVAHRLDELLNADADIDGAAPPTVGSVFHELLSKTAGSFTFDQTTDSLEALRDRGDAAWLTATGFSTHAAADVWAVATRVLTAATNITSTGGTTVPQTGDSYAIVNSGTHGNAAIKGYVDDIGTAGAGLTAVPWNAAWDAEVQSEVQDAIEANNLDHLVKIAVDTDFATTVHLDSVVGQLADNGTTATFSRTTDSLEALRDRGDAAWVTATGFSTHTAADVWSVATRVLTAGTNINGSTFTAIPWAAAWDAEVQSEVADALAVFWTSPATLVDLVWDEALSGHATAGTTGAALSAANAPTAAAVATAVWTDTTASDFTTLTSPGKIIFGQLGGAFTTTSSSVFTIAALANGPSGAGGSASAIADAVWDELLAGHSTDGSAGQLLYDALQVASAAAGSSASSSSTAYADTDDLVARYDVRAVCQLASDTDTPVEEADLGDSTRVSKALMSASGMVEAACTAGKRYMPADLAALTGVSKEFLKDIVCDLAMGRLWMSRPTESGEPPRCWSEAQKILEKLGSGLYVFGMSGAQEAGNLDVQREYAAGVETRDMQTSQAERFFGRRSNRVK